LGSSQFDLISSFIITCSLISKHQFLLKVKWAWGVCGTSSRFDILLFHVFSICLWFTTLIRLVCIQVVFQNTTTQFPCLEHGPSYVSIWLQSGSWRSARYSEKSRNQREFCCLAARENLEKITSLIYCTTGTVSTFCNHL